MNRNMTAEEDATCERALTHVVETMRHIRGCVQGDDAEGVVDVEFPTLWQAMDWALKWEVRSLVELRDPVKSVANSVVIQFNLYDYARRRAQVGFPV